MRKLTGVKMFGAQMMLIATFLGAATADTAPAARADKSVAEAYDGQCRRQAETEMCRVLRNALEAKSQKPGEGSHSESHFSSAGLEGAETSSAWGILPQLVGSMWRGPDGVWYFQWDQPGRQIRIRFFAESGDESEGWRAIIKMNKAGHLTIAQATRISKLAVMTQGNLFDDNMDAAIFLIDRDRFELQNGRLKKGVYTRSEKQDLRRNGFYTRLSSSEQTAFFARVSARAQGGGGNSGMLGSLIMGGVAAAAGGDAGMVMGAAMKGVEMTTGNEMSRNVLAGKGDSMIADGIERRAAENRTSSSASSGSSSAATPSSAGLSEVAGAATKAAAPRRTMYSYCYLSDGARATHVSGIGGKSVSVDEQQAWRASMEAEFLQQVGGASGPHQCELSERSDFTYTRGHVLADNPVVLAWAPH